MIDRDELLNHISIFLSNVDNDNSFQKKEKELEKLRRRFVDKYEKDKIPTFSLVDYLDFTKGLLYDLDELGSIKARFISTKQFRIWQDKAGVCQFKKKKYVDLDTALEILKKDIGALLSAANNNDYDIMNKIDIPPCYKGKILSTYYPDKYLSIFSKDDLDFFLVQLKIPEYLKKNVFTKRNILMKLKDQTTEMNEWTNYKYMMFLYSSFGNPRTKIKTTSPLLDRIIKSKVPLTFTDISKQKIILIDDEINPIVQSVPKNSEKKGGPENPDYEGRGIRQTQIGNHGEDLAIKYEADFLKRNSITSLTPHKVEDHLGYDILSYDENRKEKYIEVKSTLNPYTSEETTFYLTNNEYNTAKEFGDRYYIYRYFDVGGSEPKLKIIQNPLKHENKGLRLEPSQFKATLTFRKTKK